MDNFRVAVIGIGNMGSAHAACIANGEIAGMQLTAVCDVIEQRAINFADKYKGIKVYDDYNTLLSDGVADGVIIAVPHPLHAEIAIKAFNKGLHVMLEKPADISVSKVIKLNDAAKSSGCVFGIMFNQRTNPLFKKAREIVKSGKLGQLKRTVWIVTNWYRTQSYYDSGSWRATWAGEGGGVLLNQAPHNLDLWQWICGMPDSVMAFCDIAKYHNIEVEDDVTIFTRYKNGAVGTFITSTGEYPGTNRLEIIGDMGKLVLENGILKWWQLERSEREVCKTEKKSSAHIAYDYTETKQEERETAHKGILQNFANAVLFGEELIAPGEEGLFELTISNAAYLSNWEGNIEISLPFECDRFDKKLSELALSSQKNHPINKREFSNSYKDRWKVNW